MGPRTPASQLRELISDARGSLWNVCFDACRNIVLAGWEEWNGLSKREGTINFKKRRIHSGQLANPI